MPFPTTRVLAVAMAALVLMCGCTGTPSGKLTTTLTAGNPIEPVHLPEALADAAGFYSRAGIAVEIAAGQPSGSSAASRQPAPTTRFATMTLQQVLRASSDGPSWKFVVLYTRLPVPIPGQDQPDLVGLAVRADVLEQNPAEVARMTDAFVLAYQFLNTHTPTESLEALPKQVHTDNSAYRARLAMIWDHLTLVGYVGERTLIDGIAAGRAAGFIAADRTFAPADVADFGPLQHSWRVRSH